jgi:signal peptidase I
MGDVRGKAFMIYWSWDSDEFGVRWSRIGDMIH